MMKGIFSKISKKDIFLSQNNNDLDGNFKSLNILNLILKVWTKIRLKRKKQSFILFILILISGFSELLTLGSVIPFLTAITDIENLYKYDLINKICEILGLTSSNQLIILTTLIFILMICFSAIIRVINLLFNYRLTAAIGSELSSECFRLTLHQPYQKHLNTNSSVLINTVTKDINNTIKALSSLLIAINSIITSTFIFIGLLIVQPKIAILLFAILIFCYIFIVNKNKIQLEKNSYIITRKSQENIKSLQEGLGAIKEILLVGNQGYYSDIFRKTDFAVRKVRARNSFLGSFPKILLETIAIIVISSMGAIFSSNGLSGRAVSSIGFIALGSQRLLPSLQLIFSSWISVKSSTSSIFNIVNLLNQKTFKIINNTKIINFKKYLELKEVNFKYGKNKPCVLKNLSFRINYGEKIGIIGKTGSGKSTALDLLMTLIKPSDGKFLIDGRDIHKINSKPYLQNWKSQITHVPQLIYLADSSFYENIAFGENPQDINLKKVKEAASKAQLLDFIESCRYGFDTIVGERGIRLSGGQRQRIALARAFYRNKKFYILDEATSALDIETEKEVINSIFNLGPEITLIMVAHRLTTLKNCDRIIRFENGSIVEEGPPNIIL